MITRQKLYSILRTAGYTAAKYHASGRVRGWGEMSAGVQVVESNHDGAEWQIEYCFGIRRPTNAERVQRLQAIQKILVAAGIECFPNTQETALIVAPLDS